VFTPTNPADDMLTAQQVAAVLHVTVRAIRKWVKEGRFPRPKQFGRAVRWRTGDLAEVLHNGVPPLATMETKGEGVAAGDAPEVEQKPEAAQRDQARRRRPPKQPRGSAKPPTRRPKK